MAKIFRRVFIIVAIFGIFFAFNQTASASLTELLPKKGGTGTVTTDNVARPASVPESFASGKNVITLVFNIVITISGVIFLIMLLIGGIQYLTGAGNEETTGKAKKMMIDAIVGLVIVLASWAIGTWILGRLGGTATTTAPTRPTTSPPPSSTPPPSSAPSETSSSTETIFSRQYYTPVADSVYQSNETECGAQGGELSLRNELDLVIMTCTRNSLN